jgi:phosphatidylserine decarboxylase
MRLAKAGYPFVVGCLIVAIIFSLSASAFGGVFLGMLAGAAFLAAGFCAYFFRDPPRVIPQGEHLVLSPADGKVMEVIEGTDAAFTEPVWILRIFLSVFDPHIQRLPVAGTVQAIRYKTGKFLDARDPKACFENEQNRVEVRPASSRIKGPIIVTQIAGLIARRIICWVKEGQSMATGEQFGLIRFGSQVDVVLAKSLTIKVKAGDRVEAGSSVIAESTS